MRYEKIIKELSEYKKNEISKDSLLDLYIKHYKNKNYKTFINMVSLLKKYEIIADKTNDTYQIINKKFYSVKIDDNLRWINDLISKNYPDIKHITWTTGVINDFSQHYAITNYIIVETEKIAINRVLNLLKENLNHDYIVLTEDMFVKNSEYFLNENSILVIVKQLIQKAPLTKIDGEYLPSLEKIMVDLIKDQIYLQYQGKELEHIFENITDDYSINVKKLLSYAKLRGVLNNIEETLEKTKILESR